MQLLGLVLILLNVGAIATPIAGVVLLNSNDLSQIIIPTEFEEIISNTICNGESIQLPQYIGSSYDQSSRTAQVIFNFSNPFEFDLTLNTVSANIVCLDHNFALGYAALDDTVLIKQEETQTIIMNFVWTISAENHFLSQHVNASAIDAKLVEITLDISGIIIEVPEEIIISLPIVS
ncbi:hypothetical protein AC477_01845 [miscellaneous Crenarchaeota group-1 archaeon SG8-32-1]|uniref:Uncharacterized protein n=1 Tax=miscellaneous Crenarchaeota group-1 archaeon SG8-32-1 TaxID=1685124 RepID=A0A0M0BXS3_9ARCH|nr:MAG: hypothetical protein AC477_01845 [miscellaneous Crenarchaeota group-1 archaeon SG8-32-1]